MHYEQAEFGMQVLYIPTHAHNNPLHNDCEAGFITNWNQKTALVRYWNKDLLTLRTVANGERTNWNDLVDISSVPDQQVAASLQQIYPDQVYIITDTHHIASTTGHILCTGASPEIHLFRSYAEHPYSICPRCMAKQLKFAVSICTSLVNPEPGVLLDQVWIVTPHNPDVEMEAVQDFCSKYVKERVTAEKFVQESWTKDDDGTVNYFYRNVVRI